jgi:hypothetical protein
MYCATNISDPKRYRRQYGNEKQTTEIAFNDKYNVADVYFKGKWKTVKLQDGKLKFEFDFRTDDWSIVETKTANFYYNGEN